MGNIMGPGVTEALVTTFFTPRSDSDVIFATGLLLIYFL